MLRHVREPQSRKWRELNDQRQQGDRLHRRAGGADARGEPQPSVAPAPTRSGRLRVLTFLSLPLIFSPARTQPPHLGPQRPLPPPLRLPRRRISRPADPRLAHHPCARYASISVCVAICLQLAASSKSSFQLPTTGLLARNNFRLARHPSRIDGEVHGFLDSYPSVSRFRESASKKTCLNSSKNLQPNDL